MRPLKEDVYSKTTKEAYYNGKVGKMHRKRKDLNTRCPICHKPLQIMKEVYDDDEKIIKFNGKWLFINRAWDIEFCVHPDCKRHINESNIFKILDHLEIPYKDHLLAIGLDTKRKK